jgi:hypothetical protein
MIDRPQHRRRFFFSDSLLLPGGGRMREEEKRRMRVFLSVPPCLRGPFSVVENAPE